MPMRGTIQADYSKFVDECAKAEAGLAKIESQGKATEQSLVAMESSVASGKVSDAIAKTVASVDKVGQSAKASASGFGQMSEGLKVADRTLNQFGVNLGPTIGSLDEFAKVSGKTASQLGVLGTAATVAGAALAGWKIGRWIAEMTGADEAVADFASTLMGKGSVAAQTYGAQLDTIRLAIIRSGGEFRGGYTEAVKYNTEWVEKNRAAHLTGTAVIAQWEKEIKNARFGAAELTKEIKAGTLTTDQMKDKFKVSAGAIEYLKKQFDDAADAEKKVAEEAEKVSAALDRVEESRKGNMQILRELGSETVGAIKNDLELGAAQADLAIQYGTSERAIRAVAEALKADKQASEDAARATKLLHDAEVAHYKETADAGASSLEQQRLAVGTWRAEQMAALAATKGATLEQYEAIDRIAQEKLANVGVNWQTLKEGSKKALQETVEMHQITYDRMLANVNAYTPEAIAAQYKLLEASKIAADGQIQEQQRVMNANKSFWAETDAMIAAAYASAATQGKGGALSVEQAWKQAGTTSGISGKSVEESWAAAAAAGAQGMNDVANQTDKAGNAARTATGAVQQLGAAYQFAAQTSEQYFDMAAGARADAAANARGSAGGFVSGPTMAAMQRAQAEDYERRGTKLLEYERTVASARAGRTATWGTPPATGSNTLNVNVNSTDAGNIANKLITEMRNNGYRL